MRIESMILGEMSTNCYLVFDEQTRQALVIDPADSGETISLRLLELGLTLEAIALTHGHFDHVLGLLELHLNFPQTPIYLHSDDAFLLKNAQSSARHWLHKTVDPIPQVTIPYPKSGVKLGSLTFKTLELPGHTPGSVGLYQSQQSVLFSGDTVFRNGVGRTDFAYSSPLDLSTSLAKIRKLPAPTQIFPGHGEPTTVLGIKHAPSHLSIG